MNGVTYYYITNLQGDVVRIVNASGASVADYTYDPFGKVLSISGDEIAYHNPLLYRGYYYDTETGFYYLQSRYYDPTIGRFINADSLASTGQGFIGYNMFAYCGNNPINRIDSIGGAWELLFGGVVGGLVNGVCTAVTGGSFKETVASITVGAIEGVASTANQVVGSFIRIGHAIGTFSDCFSNGAGFWGSLGAASFSLFTSYVYGQEGDIFADIAVDLTFGLSFSLMSEGVNVAILNNCKIVKIQNETTHTKIFTSKDYRYPNEVTQAIVGAASVFDGGNSAYITLYR